ncbi:MAG: ABC transporter permease [Clostridiales bacterium]|nr:ABC transporter permease [Clostridiales bacterium]
METTPQTALPNEKGKWTFGELWSRFGIIFIFAGITLVVGILTRGRFTTWNNMTTIFRNSSSVGIISLGMTFVIISGGIDLSSGSVLSTAGTVLIFMQGSGKFPLIVSMLACIAVGVGFGLANGLIVTKLKTPPFITTLATGIIARSITTYVCNGSTITGNKDDAIFRNIGTGNITSSTGSIIMPVPFIMMLVVAVVLTVVLMKIKFGTYIFSVGCNENAAKYSGIKVDRIKIYTYMIVGACAGLGAIIDMSRMVSVSSTASGLNYEFDAITAVLLGGTSLAGGRGTIYGTVFGAILLFFVSNIMIQLNISTYLTGTVKGLIILGAVLLQMLGTIGQKSRLE